MSRHRNRFRPQVQLLEVRETPTVALGYAVGMGNTGVDEGNNLTTDAAGNLYVVGNFQSTVDFDPGPGITNLGPGRVFVAKYAPAGTLVWARNFTSGAQGYGIAVDATGNVYTTGSYTGTPDMDPGPGTFNLPNASNSIFVSKLDSSGNFVWAVSMASGGISRGREIGVDATGNVYVSGYINGTVDFDPGVGTFNLTGSNYDLFVSKLDSAGTFGWAVSLAGVQALNDHGFAVDAAGNTYASASFRNTIDADPGAGTFSLTSSNSDPLLLKLDTAGNFVWALQYANGGGFGGGVALDASGNIYTIGHFIGTIDFDPGAGNFSLTGGSWDNYVVKLDSAGSFLWAGIVQGLFEGDVAVGPAGDVYITGFFDSATRDFDPGPGTYNLTFSGGSYDIYVCNLTSSGSFGWAVSLGGTSTDQGRAVTVDPLGRVFATGYFSGTADFDPGPGTYNLIGSSNDIFITGLIGSQITVTSSGGSTTLSESGATDTYTIVLDAQPLADVIITLTPDSQVTASVSALTFTTVNWNLPQTVTVTAVDDALNENNHTGVITHSLTSTDTNYNGGAAPALTASITDNDLGNATITQTGGTTAIAESGTTDSFTVVLTYLPTTNVVIALNPDTQATVAPTSLTFTPVNWNVPRTVTVSAVNDAVAESLHSGVLSFTVTSTDPSYSSLTIPALTASITDDDTAGVTFAQTAGSTSVSEAGASDTVTVVLTSQPTASVVFTLNPDAQLTTAPTTLTFTPLNWNTAQTAAVMAVNDLAAEGTHNGVVAAAASSTDTNYNGIAIASLTASVTDNDSAGVTLTQSGGSTLVTEGGATDGYQVVLDTPPAANVVLTFSSTSLTTTPATLTFTPATWNVAQPINVAAVDDVVYQGPHTGTITHTASSADTFYNGLPIATLTVSITDNDPPPGVFITEPAGGLTPQEGATTSYTLVLQTQPAADVVVNLTPDAQVSVGTPSLLFTTSNWNVPQTVTLATIDDAVPETNQLGIVSHTVTSADAAYAALAVPAATAHIVDNDGTLVLGTERDDRILVNFTSGKVQAIVNGKVSWLSGPVTQIVVRAQEGNDFVQITAPGLPVIVLGGDGSDALWVIGSAGLNSFVLDTASTTVNGKTVDFAESESLVLGGRTGNDTFRIQNLPAIVTELKGDRGNDAVFAPDTDNAWNVTNVNSGNLNTSLVINGIENWLGGAGDDTFTFADRKTLAGKLDGGAGNNTVDYSAYTAAISVNLQTGAATGTKLLANVQSLVGGRAADRLIGPNQSNLWSLTDTNAGDVNGILFTGFESLTGGTSDDTFTLADGTGITGKLDGGLGSDLLDYSACSTAVAVNLQAKSATGTVGILNLEQFVAGSSSADTLVAANTSNKWTLAATGAGKLNTQAFTEFENLTGGSNTDTFTLTASLANWLGVLDGAGGRDALLSYAGSLNLWTNGVPGAGTLNGRAFAGIELRK